MAKLIERIVLTNPYEDSSGFNPYRVSREKAEGFIKNMVDEGIVIDPENSEVGIKYRIVTLGQDRTSKERESTVPYNLNLPDNVAVRSYQFRTVEGNLEIDLRNYEEIYEDPIFGVIGGRGSNEKGVIAEITLFHERGEGTNPTLAKIEDALNKTYGTSD